MVAVKVAPGDEVTAGDVVAVVSAMKMEMAVQAQVTGKVRVFVLSTYFIWRSMYGTCLWMSKFKCSLKL